MAATIDLTAATTAEGQVLMLVTALNNLENANVDSDGTPLTDNIQITPNNETDTIALALNLPVTAVTTADGVTYTADTFL